MLVVLLATASAAAFQRVAVNAQIPASSCGIDMRLLVISADGTEAGLPAIQQTLDYLATPYAVYVASTRPGGLTSSFLADGCHAKYQAIILTTNELAFASPTGWRSALSGSEFQALAAYEAQFKIRQVTWYTFPNPDTGFNWGVPHDTAVSPLAVQLTNAGVAAFSYLATAGATTISTSSTHGLWIENAYAFLATPLDGATVPLVVDAANHPLIAVRNYPDGRENMALTFDSNPYLVHAVLFGYGVVSWATRGVFIGERHVYMSPQVDDIFIPDQRWTAATACGTNPELTRVELRIDAADLARTAAWQVQRNLEATTAKVRLTMAFNGEGTVDDASALTATAKTVQKEFYWVNHTFDHTLLDPLDYSAAWDEIYMNNEVARRLKLTSYSKTNLVTPEISGLTNVEVMEAAYKTGVRYVVSDTSKPGYGNPLPNIGRYNPLQPAILMIPRRPNNLFYNVGTPQDWTAEYNCLYHAFWGRDLTYDEILEFESQTLATYMLRGENDPWMFHQTNLYSYDGQHSLLADLLDRALTKYNRYYTLPILSPTMDALGVEMAARMAFLAAKVAATLNSDGSIALSSDRAVTVPITGAAVGGAEVYGGQTIAHIKIAAHQTVTVAPAPSVAPPPKHPKKPKPRK